MAVQKDRSITLGGTDLSSSLRALTVTEGETTLSGETHGDDWEWFENGMRNGSLVCQFKQDWSSGGVDATISALAGTTFAVVVKPASGSVSTSNPSFTMTCMIEEYERMAGEVGDQQFCQLTLALAADTGIARATA